MTDVRTRQERKRDVLKKLGAPADDVWVSTDDPDGMPSMVPVTLAWHAERIVLATVRTSPTARNLTTRRTAKISLGPTGDVVMIDAELESTLEVAEAGPAGDAFAAQTAWDPRCAGAEYVFMVLRPAEIQAWREDNEIRGRTIMKRGSWLA